MKKKGMLVVAIILMSIGFAAVSTTLIINGSTNIGENTDDYSVIFTKATLDGIDVYNEVTSQDKKTITFRSNDLKKLNDTSVLTYEVTNNSSNYDAEVKINCGVKENTTAKYTSIKNELENNVTVVKAKESVNGTLTVTLNQTTTEEITEEYTCTLEFKAVERDTLGSSEPTYYYAFGTPTIESATDYTTLGKNVFARLGSDDSKAVCINDNGLFCIKTNDYDNSVLALKNHFGESACRDSSSYFSCSSDAFDCTANSYGNVSCNDISANEFCNAFLNGYVCK